MPQINYTVIITIVNFIILAIILMALYKAIRGIRNFVNRNKELNKKVDAILSKLEDKENKKHTTKWNIQEGVIGFQSYWAKQKPVRCSGYCGDYAKYKYSNSNRSGGARNSCKASSIKTILTSRSLIWSRGYF